MIKIIEILWTFDIILENSASIGIHPWNIANHALLSCENSAHVLKKCNSGIIWTFRAKQLNIVNWVLVAKSALIELNMSLGKMLKSEQIKPPHGQTSRLCRLWQKQCDSDEVTSIAEQSTFYRKCMQFRDRRDKCAYAFQSLTPNVLPASNSKHLHCAF